MDLNSLQTSLKDMSQEEIVELVRTRRAARRTPPAQPKKAAKEKPATQKSAAKAKDTVLSFLQNMSPEDKAALLQSLQKKGT